MGIRKASGKYGPGYQISNPALQGPRGLEARMFLAALAGMEVVYVRIQLMLAQYSSGSHFQSLGRSGLYYSSQ